MRPVKYVWVRRQGRRHGWCVESVCQLGLDMRKVQMSREEAPSKVGWLSRPVWKPTGLGLALADCGHHLSYTALVSSCPQCQTQTRGQQSEQDWLEAKAVWHLPRRAARVPGGEALRSGWLVPRLK